MFQVTTRITGSDDANFLPGDFLDRHFLTKTAFQGPAAHRLVILLGPSRMRDPFSSLPKDSRHLTLHQATLPDYSFPWKAFEASLAVQHHNELNGLKLSLLAVFHGKFHWMKYSRTQPITLFVSNTTQFHYIIDPRGACHNVLCTTGISWREFPHGTCEEQHTQGYPCSQYRKNILVWYSIHNFDRLLCQHIEDCNLAKSSHSSWA